MPTVRIFCWLLVLVVTTSTWGGCKFDPQFPEDLYVRCVDGRCPAPCTCTAGICLAPGPVPNPDLCRGQVGTCGDGLLEPALGEQCDDGRHCAGGLIACDDPAECDGIGDGSCVPRAGDGCDQVCRFEPVGAACGDERIDPLEVCDDGMHCADWMPCDTDSDCSGLPDQPPFDNRCLPRNSDGCNPTCNFIGQAETFLLPAGLPTMASDNTWLWMAGEGSGTIARVDIRACIANLEQHPCQPGPPANCPHPCAVETVATGLLNPSAPATDGRRLWFFEQNYQIASYVKVLDIAACDAALAAGGDCSGLVRAVAGSDQWDHLDGIGDAAAFMDNRGLTYHAGMLYLVDGNCGTLRRVDPESGQVTTLVGSARPTCPSPGAAVGQGTAARLNSPRYMTSDGADGLIVSDNLAHAIYRFDLQTGRLERFVGNGTAGYVDALDGLDAEFNRPRDLASDGTSLYVADYNNQVIRQVDLTSRRVSTLAGQAGACGQTPGTGQVARLGLLFSLAYHFPSGSLFSFSGQDDACPSATVDQLWRIR